MPIQPDSHPWNVRALLESTATPFTVADYGPRAVIFRQGDPCDCVMHIERGRVWLAVAAHSGKEAICSLLDAGAFLGEEALTGCAERRQSATAMTPTQVLVVATAHMNRLVRTQPGLLDRFLAHLLARNVRLEDTLTEQLLYSSEQRLVHLLLVLARWDERRPGRCALPDVTQDIIAEMVGTTRSRVNTILGKFKKRGFIEKRNGLLHVNPARLDVVEDRVPRVSRAAYTAIRMVPDWEENRALFHRA
jgi:CRP/FNR family cyclic AMP-dependent transcriptional regulator